MHGCGILEFEGFDDSEPGDSDEEAEEKELRLQAKERSGISPLSDLGIQQNLIQF